MYPALSDNDMVITQKTYLSDYEYERGEIIIAGSKEIVVVKRIIGLPGEKITLKENNIYINDVLIDEKYLPDEWLSKQYSSIYEDSTYYVPQNSYFVLGDNRTNSRDSRFIEFGYIDRDDIYGLVIFRYYPGVSFGQIETGEIEH
jgi:signal peptidase I